MKGSDFCSWLDNPNKNTLVMGILNVTPDSFSDGGKYLNIDDAVSHALLMEEEGADIIDIGGESTRPGSDKISIKEEVNRIYPVIKGIREKSDITISIDTYKSEVAQVALSVGADLINDISGMTFDHKMIEILKENNVPIIIMHIKGTPKNMQDNPRYSDVIREIISFFYEQTQKAINFGIEPKKIIIDPGIGFGKSINDNYRILNLLSEFSKLGYPVLVGPSRKSFIGETLNLPLNKRLEGTIASVTAAIINGASIVRVHDVKEVKRAVDVTDRILHKKEIL